MNALVDNEGRFRNDDGTFKDVNYEKCRTKKDCKAFTKCKDLP